MYMAHQRDRWDHTAAMLAAWSEKRTDIDAINPYRTKTRRAGYMRPAELYARMAAIDRRNQT